MVQLLTKIVFNSFPSHALQIIWRAWFFSFFLIASIAHSEEILSSPTPTPLPSATPSLQESADAAYDAGDCDEAISLYQKIINQNMSDLSTKSQSLFKIAYCNYSEANFAEAENFFKQHLALSVDHEEAQLKYLDSLFQQGKFKEVTDRNHRYPFTWSRNDALLLMGRSYLEQGDPEKALDEFHQMNPNIRLLPVQQYWMGVAEYQRGDKKSARHQFKYAKAYIKAPEWVRNYSEDWLQSLDKELRALSGALAIGYFSDGNIASSSIQNVGANGLPTTLNASTSDALTDTGYFLNGRILGTLYDEHPLSFQLQLDWNSPFYSKYSAYNNENLGLELQAQYIKSAKERYHFSLRYLDSRYQNLYYQDYVIATPGIAWYQNPRWLFNFDLPITQYILSRSGTLLSPIFGVKFLAKSWLSINAGINYSKARSDPAVYQGTSLISGTQFSNYSSYGGTLGCTLQLPLGFSLALQTSYYKTHFAEENYTASGGMTRPEARNDTLLLINTDLSKEIKSGWSLNLNYNYYSNQSAGFQGIATASTMTIYSYKRPYALLSSTIQF